MLLEANLNFVVGTYIRFDSNTRDSCSVTFNPPRPIGWLVDRDVIPTAVASWRWRNNTTAFKRGAGPIQGHVNCTRCIDEAEAPIRIPSI